MKIIITGATGFVGRNLAEKLKPAGFEVIATGRNKKIGEELLKQGIEFKPVDILDFDRLAESFSAADCVIHCAARAGGWGKYEEFHRPNVNGTCNVIGACKLHGIGKLIFISSPSVYYSGKDRFDIRENEPLPEKKSNHYSVTKKLAESRLIEEQSRGLKSIILRPRAVHGPYDTIIVPHILRLAEKGSVPLINAGKAYTDVTYIDNLVLAVEQCLLAGDEAWNETYNISNGEPINVRDWFKAVLEAFERPFNPKDIPTKAAKLVAFLMEMKASLPLMGGEPPMTRFSVGYLSTSMTMSIEKAKQKLKYEPFVANQQGFELHAQWYKSQQN